jgi:hypothetical protein
MAEIPALFGQRPIVERHAKSALYVCVLPEPHVQTLTLTRSIRLSRLLHSRWWTYR